MLTEPKLTPGEINGLTAEASPASGDFVAIVDISSGQLKKATLANVGTTLLTGVVLADGTVPLTAAWDAGSFGITAETFTSDVATGTAPLTVSSTTKVTNLNADQIDGADLNDSGTGSTDIWSASKTISYLQNAIDLRDPKDSVRAASTANVTLTTDVENGDTLDGVTLATGDRILLKNQTTASENGIYTVAASGAPSRTSDLDTGDGAAGATIPVNEGTANADTIWFCTSNAGSDVVGTDSLSFSQVGSGGAGVTTLNGETGSSQTFAKADDTNVTLTIGSATNTHTFTVGWTGTLALTRGGLGANLSSGDGFVQIKSGSATVVKTKHNATAAPTATDDSGSGYGVGSRWIDVTNDKEYVCLDATSTAAVWTETTASGSLAHWTEANATPVANEVTSWTPSTASSNADVVVAPKGTGAFSLQIADGTATGGNDRGLHAVDLQKTRSAANEVASGTSSFVVGTGNRASGSGTVAAGSNNVAANSNSIALGVSCTSSGIAAVAAGSNATASAAYATALGQFVTASGTAARAHGSSCTADGEYSSAVGLNADCQGIYGKHAFAAGRFSADGDAQAADYPLRRSTNSASPAPLTTNASTAFTDNQIVLQDNSLIAFEALVVGRDTSGTDACAYRIFGLAKRGASAATTAIVGSLQVDTIKTNASLDVTAIADTTNGAVQIQVTGLAATTIHWHASVRTSEVL